MTKAWFEGQKTTTHIMISSMTKQEIIDEAKAIMTHWEVSGYHSPNDVPECDEKERYIQLMRSLGFDVKF